MTDIAWEELPHTRRVKHVEAGGKPYNVVDGEQVPLEVEKAEPKKPKKK